MTKDEIQDEALAAVLPHYRCTAAMSMGTGKTLLGLKHMAHNYTDYARFLVAAPKNTIFETWKEEAAKYNLEYLLDHIEFTSYLSLSKQSQDYDVLYLDECHSLKESHDSWLSGFEGKILGLTGTPPKYANSEKGIMINRYCPVVYKYLVDDAVGDRLLNDYRIVVHTLPLNKAKTMLVKSKKGDKQWYSSEEATYNYWTARIDNASTKKELQIMRVMRMKAMMEFPSKEALARQIMNSIVANKEKCLVFCNTQEQADRMCPYSVHSSNDVSDDNLEKFKQGTINMLSCVLQLSEGINIPNLKYGIILHAYGNERKASQRIGRLLRLNPKETATAHILCYKDTVDEQWVRQALEDFDKTKITWK